ncbi:hypothetical protein BDA99DRAFT_431415 [Phascolomyces articulosus]|uniref:Uncharacterized protein n=1 Tax=Phascolomyces articulosus TaxID=60185 RepID=A0AAD5KSX4_9FUNG|nr:hypothetical protein BDA99DRAFT_431415 [Phascolomyces articulosus]
MASRFVSTTRLVRAPLARQMARRTFASDAKDASPKFAEETFNGNIWRNTAIAIIAGVVIYRVDQHLTKQGDEKHPVTKWIEYHMESSDDMDKLNQQKLDEASKLAEYRLVAQDAQRAPIYRLRNPESFERASPRGLVTGNQVDLSDLKVRSD